jgi:peptide/nickel transport system ATP-binding protein
MAMSLKPTLMILDEPTTGLDVTTEVAVLDIFRELIEGGETAVIYISHNLGVISEVCERVIVLYAGEIAEDASTVDLYRQPLHPYSQGLLESVPRLGDNKRDVKLRPIQGRIPQLDALPHGCIFRPRCPLAIEVCEQFPPLYEPSPDRRSRCHRWEEIEQGHARANQPEPGEVERVDTEGSAEMLVLEDLKVHFSSQGSFLDELLDRGGVVRAVDGISVEIPPGETLGLVGESGSGKTTTARAIVGLRPRTGGEIKLGVRRLEPNLSDRDAAIMRKLQIVFQDPDQALNPYLTVGESLCRPLMRLLGTSRAEAEARSLELIDAVHLPAEFADRLPGQLSGGEKQRVAIARAFASNPELLVADEPVSSLDVSVQASVVNVIHELQQKNASSSLFISHDLAIVGFLSDRVAVVYLGRLMEVAAAKEIFDPPYHPYTEALLSAIPLLDPEGEHAHIRLQGELPSLSDYPTGCPFHTRCPRFIGDICVEQEPPWRETESGRRIYCHIPLGELRDAQKRAFRLTGALTSVQERA